MNTSNNLFNSLTIDHIAVKIKAVNWEDAIESAGRIMENSGLTLPIYTEAMKETIKKLGPYSVIAPGIAMPHARPDDGVIQTGFSLITLDSPVEFGSEANDPVDIIIGFAAVDKDSHITALQEIASNFGDINFVKDIREARTKEDLFCILDSKRKTL